ncbi:hypothetical protein [Pseudoalteromonas ruthenica]|uniref:hypothetical protein n=1 Tax=Pseudoalteromonas ruthenica TaxID=151081 RepID=UPI0012476509|nr:hypothetical protein [Pseudoalteromonas ruthenica]
MNKKEKVESFSWVLSDLIVDLGTSSKLYFDCTAEPNHNPEENNYHLGLLRMCYMTTVISLSKLIEALNGFANELKECCPLEVVDTTWQIKRKIENMKVYEFRNKYVAHVFDKETGKPIDLIAGKERLSAIIGSKNEHVSDFYKWVNQTLLDQLLNINDSLDTYVKGISSRK